MRNDYIFNFFLVFFFCSSPGAILGSLSLAVSLLLFSVFTVHGRHHFTFAYVTGVHSIPNPECGDPCSLSSLCAYFSNWASSSSKTKRQQRKINETVARHQDMGCSWTQRREKPTEATHNAHILWFFVLVFLLPFASHISVAHSRNDWNMSNVSCSLACACWWLRCVRAASGYFVLRTLY